MRLQKQPHSILRHNKYPAIYPLQATTTCKNVETLPRKNDLSCFKSLLVTGLWDIILTSLLPPIQSCSSKFWVWSCIASNFDKGWRGDHKHKIMDRPFMPKYGTVSQLLLQLVVAIMLKLTVFKFICRFTHLWARKTAVRWPTQQRYPQVVVYKALCDVLRKALKKKRHFTIKKERKER